MATSSYFLETGPGEKAYFTFTYKELQWTEPMPQTLSEAQEASKCNKKTLAAIHCSCRVEWCC